MKLTEAMSGMAQSRPMGNGGKPQAAAGESSDGHSELHPHGDGTYHTVVDGEKTEHPHIGHALAHLAGHHEPDGKHSHVQHNDDGTHTSHHHDGASVSGPHDHKNLEELKGHFDKFLNEEGNEHGGYSSGSDSGSDSMFD